MPDVARDIDFADEPIDRSIDRSTDRPTERASDDALVSSEFRRVRNEIRQWKNSDYRSNPHLRS